MSKILQILYHGNCFDGTVSAAIFARFFRERVDPAAEVAFRAMTHGTGDPYGPDHDATFSAEVNAVLDFRYSPSPRLQWFCDHHVSSFLRPEDRQHLEADRSGQKRFDPTAPSCAGLLLRWLAETRGFDPPLFQEHVRWADIIDAARFASPAQAVELAEPALRLMALLDAAPEPDLIEEILAGLMSRPIADLLEQPRIESALGPMLAAHRASVEVFRRVMKTERGVAYFDLSSEGLEGFNKFIPYYLDPSIRCSVGLTCSPRRAKVSVGSNPWLERSPEINIAEICARYGGGGHPAVGAASFPPAELESARRASLEIAELLRRLLEQGQPR